MSNFEEDDVDSNILSATNFQKAEDLSMIEITVDQINSKTHYIFSTLAQKLNELNKTVSQYFYLQKKFHEVNGEGIFEVIDLKQFITCLESLFNHKLDKIDSYCIFSKLKYLDKYPSIDANKLIAIMKEYGVNEDHNENKDIQFIDNLSRFLKEKKKTIFDLLLINDGTETFKMSDFVGILSKQGLLFDEQIPHKIAELILCNGIKDLVDLHKLNNLLTDMLKFKTGNFNHLVLATEETFSNFKDEKNENENEYDYKIDTKKDLTVDP